MKRLLLLMTAAWVGSVGTDRLEADPTGLAQEPDARVFRQVLRKPGDDGSKAYRIPGLATTTRTLLAVFDVRYGGGADLPADIDVGLMRSTDDVEIWSPMQRIRDFMRNWLGVRPKSHLVRRASRCDDRLEQRASQAEVTSDDRLCSNSSRAHAKSLEIS